MRANSIADACRHSFSPIRRRGLQRGAPLTIFLAKSGVQQGGAAPCTAFDKALKQYGKALGRKHFA
jgi:hypothetical protein